MMRANNSSFRFIPTRVGIAGDDIWDRVDT